MLDKGQIKDWDGEPETNVRHARPAPNEKPSIERTPAEKVASDVLEGQKHQLLHREAVPTGERVRLTPEQEKARKRRGQWLALGLLTFVILIFMLTMTKMGAQILVRDL